MKILIFGCNGCGKEAALALDEQDEVIGILDNNARNMKEEITWGNKVLTIYHPDDISCLEYDLIVLPISDYYEDMEKQLLQLGCPDKKIVRWNENKRFAVEDNRIRMFKLCVERIRALGLEGACAEVGVYQGDFAKYINASFPDKKLYLFDTYNGFVKSELEHSIINDYKNKTFADTSIETVMSKMQYKENVIIKKGCFPKTAEGLKDQFVFVSLDADLYDPIKSGLEFFWPKMVRGGYIFVHDYGTYVYKGVREAVDEFCQENHVAIIPILDRCLSAVFVKY